ncbi:hypothetical protein C8Q80DRAFT_232121 [Daedaleopsis nitida]|nr:hypothetical protein C8Q80DRAFT_232121 [Daedaleopsis nitida]
MIVQLTHVLCILLNVLLVIADSSAQRPPEQLVKLTTRHDLDGSSVWQWIISQHEHERLTALLQRDFAGTGLVSTFLNSPPEVCEHCGKETEFVDWVYTALTRGVHTPEFIYESLVLGNSPKGVQHDVYCSRCGHLTAFRNVAGAEGLAPHISFAPPYDRATRTFAKVVGNGSTAAEEALPSWLSGDASQEGELAQAHTEL